MKAKKYTIILTEKQRDTLDNMMCYMADAMNDVDETRPGGIIPTPEAFRKYVPKALAGWSKLHDIIMEQILRQTGEADEREWKGK